MAITKGDPNNCLFALGLWHMISPWKKATLETRKKVKGGFVTRVIIGMKRKPVSLSLSYKSQISAQVKSFQVTRKSQTSKAFFLFILSLHDLRLWLSEPDKVSSLSHFSPYPLALHTAHLSKLQLFFFMPFLLHFFPFPLIRPQETPLQPLFGWFPQWISDLHLSKFQKPEGKWKKVSKTKQAREIPSSVFSALQPSESKMRKNGWQLPYHPLQV